MPVIQAIRNRFEEIGSPADIPYVGRRGTFQAELTNTGIYVNNLRTQPFLPWIVFSETVRLLEEHNRRAIKGNAMGPRLGDPELPLDSIEGHVAATVYGKQIGDSIFRRITPICGILVWAGVCENRPRELILL